VTTEVPAGAPTGPGSILGAETAGGEELVVEEELSDEKELPADEEKFVDDAPNPERVTTCIERWRSPVSVTSLRATGVKRGYCS